VDLFEIDSVPEPERMAVARQVAGRILAKVAPGEGATADSGPSGTSAAVVTA
jgi:hypothetical protein